MATTAETIRTEYPLPVYNYRVEIGSEAMAFSEVSGLNIAYDVGTYKESPVASQAGPRTLYYPAQSTATTISLKKGIVKGVSIKALYGWIQTVQTNQVEKRMFSSVSATRGQSCDLLESGQCLSHQALRSHL